MLLEWGLILTLCLEHRAEILLSCLAASFSGKKE